MSKNPSPAVGRPVTTTELEQAPVAGDGAPAAAGTAPLADMAHEQPASSSGISLPSLRVLARWLLVAAALYGVGWLLWSAAPALTPFVIGLVLAYLLTPLVNRLDERLPRWLAILLVYVIGTVLVVSAFTFVIPPLIDQIQSLIKAIPSIDRIEELGNRLLTQYQSSVPGEIREPINNGVSSAIRTLQTNFTTYIQRAGGFVLNQVLQIVNTITFLIGFLIIPIWLFYVLNDQNEGKRFVDGLLHPRIRPDFWHTWTIVNRILMDYVRGQLVLCAAVGLATGVGLLFLRLLGVPVQYVLLLAIVAGITEFIPVIGPIIGAIPAVLLALFSDNPSSAIWVTLVYVVVQQLENNILVPRIIGESVGVHPAILTVLLIAMGQIFGLLGVILAAPLAAIARDLFLYVYRRLSGLAPEAAHSSLSDGGGGPDLNAVNEPKPAQ